MASWDGYGQALANTLGPAHYWGNTASGRRFDVVKLPNGMYVPYDQYMAQHAGNRPSDEQEIADMPVKERTQEEIEAQLLARYRELQEQAAKIEAQEAAERQRLKCSECRWACNGQNKFDRRGIYCRNALLTGFEGPQPNVDRVEQSYTGRYSLYPKTRLCGPEKALWEPIPTRWQQLVEWLGEYLARKLGLYSN